MKSDATNSETEANLIEIPTGESTFTHPTETDKTPEVLNPTGLVPPSQPTPVAILPPNVISKPSNPENVVPSEPKIVSPPDEEELSPAEIIARKLISHDSGDNLEVLNEALQRWLTKKDTLPERVGDLVTEQFLPMLPMAPDGKVFTIDPESRRVVLVTEKK